MPFALHAYLQDGEALLRFPYDDGLRKLLRALPGRRWDPELRVWRLPLDPESAEAVGQILERLPVEPEISEELARRAYPHAPSQAHAGVRLGRGPPG